MIDGKSMLRMLREEMNEASTSTFMDDRTSYSFLHQAAMGFVGRTLCLTNEQSIATVANQSGYTLNANFMQLYLMNPQGFYYIKYNDGTTDTFLEHKDYKNIIYDNETASQTVPTNFAIIDDSTKDIRLSGTTTSAGAASAGESTLTDTGADFADVSPADIVHNTTDGSDGVILSKTSSTALVTALFDGTVNDWSSTDAYVIQPQPRFKLVLDAPPSTSGHTMTVYYIEKPDPVYSDYGIYRIPGQHLESLVEFAVAKYKMRDSDPAFAQTFLTYWNAKIRGSANALNQTFLRKGFEVNMKKRR
jgi:hypothetical protein